MPVLSQIGLTREVVEAVVLGKTVSILPVSGVTQGQLLAIVQSVEDAAHRTPAKKVNVKLRVADILLHLGFNNALSTLWKKVGNLRYKRRNMNRGRRGQTCSAPSFDDELFVGPTRLLHLSHHPRLPNLLPLGLPAFIKLWASPFPATYQRAFDYIQTNLGAPAKVT